MFRYLIQGYLLGLAYVAPIGMQNLYVINTAIAEKRIRAYQTAIITIFFDISLALSCFWGIGVLMEKIKLLRIVVLFLGSVIVFYIGVQLIRSTPSLETDDKPERNGIKIIAACFGITWLNPQAIIDGSLLLGGFKASLPYENSIFFIGGVCLASLSWFMFLATVVSMFKKKIDKVRIKKINILCGTIIIYYALKLAYSFMKILF